MNNTQLTIFKAASNISTKSLLIQLCLVTVSFFLTVTSAAATNENSTQDYKNSTNEYVDSVHQWGAWGLDIEPAAGGLQAPAAQALKTRNAKVRLRTNSIAALAPQRPETITRAPAPLPVTPPAPVMPTVKPTVPSITPINPRIPVPVGGPGDGF